jgi:hypothetical protein
MEMPTIIWYMLERERNEPYRGFDRRLMDVKLKRMSNEESLQNSHRLPWIQHRMSFNER